MPRLEIDVNQIEQLIEQLSERDKIQLVRRLENKTLSARWKSFLRLIGKRRKKVRLSRREIDKIVEKARQEVYEKSRR